MADCSRHGQDGNAHNYRPSPQHHLPIHRPSCKRVRPERPQPHLRACPNTRSACPSLVPKLGATRVYNREKRLSGRC